MTEWSADKIIAVGITAALLLTVIGADAVAVMNGDMEITALGREIASGLLGYMGRGFVQTMQQRAQEPKNRESGSCGDTRTKTDANLDTERKD